MPALKLDKDLWERVKRCAALAGYSGPEEFIQHLIEKELSRLNDDQTDDQVLEKLKGLGYID